MTVAAESKSHVTLDGRGTARIDGTRWKVLHIAEAARHLGLTPQQMHEQWPDLTLAQIHSALSYYYDHQAAMDAEMDRQLAAADEIRKESRDNVVVKRLREAGKVS